LIRARTLPVASRGLVRALGDFWFRALSFTRIYRRLVLLERPLSRPVPEISVRASVRIAVLADDELGAYLAFRPDQAAAEIRRRLAQGHQCFVGWHDAQIIHVAWAATSRARIEYLSWDLALAPDEVYVYDAFTAPAFRGCGVSPLRARALGLHFHAHGFRGVVTAVRPENRAGFRPLQKVGTRPVGVIGYVGIGPWRWPFYRRVPSADSSP
jgi:hypothetical protein